MNDLEKTEKKLPSKTAKRPARKPIKFKLKKGSGTIIAIVLLLIMGAVTVYLANGIIGAGASALFDSYNSAYASERDAAYQAQYEKYYERAEQEYHVSNRVSVSIGDLRETAALEVLTVSDVEYIVEEGSTNSNGITSWLEVPGQGTYIVDLQAAEFIVDDERGYVLVRAPYPELTNITINYANVQKLFFKNDLLNDSYKVGEELARKQLGSADMLIKKEFASNQHFYLSAQEAARSTIQCLVKQLNPELPDLDVDVEFY